MHWHASWLAALPNLNVTLVNTTTSSGCLVHWLDFCGIELAIGVLFTRSTTTQDAYASIPSRIAGRCTSNEGCMIHEFCLVLAATDLNDDHVNALYQFGLDDATVSTSQGTTRIDV